MVRKCSHCGRDAPKRLSGGWKVHQEETWCPTCWRKSFIIRACTIPIAGPAGSSANEIKERWKELRGILKDRWSEATQLSNFAINELAKNDIVRTATMEKLPPQPKRYLYPDARRLTPNMPTGSVTAVLNSVERSYRAKRYNSIWLCRENLPRYRHPTPFPIAKKSWRTARIDGRPGIEVKLDTGRGPRWVLRLRGGPQFSHQLKMFKQIESGEAVQGELTLYEKVASRGRHRPGSSPGKTLMAKMVAWFPRQETPTLHGSLNVRTDSDSMLIYHVEGSTDIRYYHADHAKRWVAEHQTKLARVSDDTKQELRIPRRRMRQLIAQRQRWARKYRNRMNTLCSEVTKYIVNFAVRRRVKQLVYDDKNRGWIDSFPWFKLKEELRTKCETNGIGLTLVEESDHDK